MISCLCPTFNRFPQLGFLLEEAVECFLRQDYADKELLILNDTPGQKLRFEHPQVRIFNSERRLSDLSAKIQYLIDRADGDYFCRWDDDDLSFPWRLSYSFARVRDAPEWRPENFWFANADLPWKEDRFPGNSHVMSIFTRAALERLGGRYPAGYSGGEDLAFNRLLAEAGHPARGELIPREEMFYVYRWGTGSRHLSGVSDGSAQPHQAHWDSLGRLPIEQGLFTLRPHWRCNYTSLTSESAHREQHPRAAVDV
jgi:glycosyltransferase involved in cell wall biosynthesis